MAKGGRRKVLLRTGGQDWTGRSGSKIDAEEEGERDERATFKESWQSTKTE